MLLPSSPAVYKAILLQDCSRISYIVKLFILALGHLRVFPLTGLEHAAMICFSPAVSTG